jgi:hypothetical protein
MKNQLIIFSKNRACQLNLLLDSLKINSGDLFDNIAVLYTFNEEYRSGYEKLKLIQPAINFKLERNFRNNLLSLINDNYEATTFMVDDAILFRPIIEKKIDIIKSVIEDSVIFSLRLGQNCVYSHPANLHYTLNDHEIDNKYIIFDYTKQQIGDFKYPLSTDGHIFNTQLIKNLLVEIDFINPNTLEHSLQKFVNSNFIPKIIKCFIDSKLVSVPVNLVNNVFKNRHGLEFGISENELNNKFLSNEIIDINLLDFSNINGPHKEIKYVFKKS